MLIKRARAFIENDFLYKKLEQEMEATIEAKIEETMKLYKDQRNKELGTEVSWIYNYVFEMTVNVLWYTPFGIHLIWNKEKYQKVYMMRLKIMQWSDKKVEKIVHFEYDYRLINKGRYDNGKKYTGQILF